MSTESLSDPASKKMFNTLIPLLLAFNFFLTLGFFILRWRSMSFATNEVYLLFFYFLLLIAATIFSYKKEKIKSAVLLWNTSHFFLIIIFCLIELFFSLFPNLLPQSLLQFNPSLMYKGQGKAEMIEYLDESPWVKFKPNTVIMSMGARGEDFTYSWKTDFLGFKNLPSIANSNDIKAVALGDSLVEGMGVAVEDTWTSIISNNGFMVYNLGVQGYAPIQMVGALKEWGKRFKPEFIIFGYTPGFERRDLHFLKLDQVLKRKEFIGGIQSINNYMKERRSIFKYFKTTNTILDFIKDFLQNMRQKKNPLDSRSIFYSYFRDVTEAQQEVFDKDSLEFNLIKEDMLEVKKITDEMSAKMIVVIFAQRPLVYYGKVLDSKPPQNHYELLTSKAVKEFCKSNQIDVIDLFVPFRNYMDNLSRTGRLSLANLPYFEKDGHVNEVGQKIIAKEVLNYFENKQKGR